MERFKAAFKTGKNYVYVGEEDKFELLLANYCKEHRVSKMYYWGTKDRFDTNNKDTLNISSPTSRVLSFFYSIYKKVCDTNKQTIIIIDGSMINSEIVTNSFPYVRLFFDENDYVSTFIYYPNPLDVDIDPSRRHIVDYFIYQNTGPSMEEIEHMLYQILDQLFSNDYPFRIALDRVDIDDLFVCTQTLIQKSWFKFSLPHNTEFELVDDFFDRMVITV